MFIFQSQYTPQIGGVTDESITIDENPDGTYTISILENGVGNSFDVSAEEKVSIETQGFLISSETK